MFNNLLLNRAKLFLALLTYKITRQRKPIVAYLLVTGRCNRRCRYCFVDCSDPVKDLSLKRWQEIIDTLHQQGTKMICLMGGEPLVYQHIDQLVDYIKSKGIICEMTTNGFLVKAKLDTIKKLDSLMISLDGDKKANDSNRGAGSYDMAIEAIKLAINNGVTVRVNSVLTQQSKKSIKHLLDLTDKYNLFVTYSILAEFPEKEKALAKNIMLADKEIKQTYIKLKKWKQKGKRILFSLSTFDYVINYPVSYKKIILKNDPQANYYPQQCLFGQAMFYLDADGSFYPCAALWNSKHYTAPNMFKLGFKKAWQQMGDLKCQSCSCPGVPEWNHITSPAGIWDGLKITLRQLFTK